MKDKTEGILFTILGAVGISFYTSVDIGGRLAGALLVMSIGCIIRGYHCYVIKGWGK